MDEKDDDKNGINIDEYVTMRMKGISQVAQEMLDAKMSEHKKTKPTMTLIQGGKSSQASGE